MKKLLFTAVIGVIVLSSCNQSKECECVTTITGALYPIPPTTSQYTIKDGDCSDNDNIVTVTNSGITQTTTVKCTEN